MTDHLYQEIGNLRQDLAERDETIRQLKERLSDGPNVFVGVAGLTRMEARIAGILVQRGRATTEVLETGESGKALQIHIVRIRRKLKPHGVEIKTLYGVGYEMPLESRRKMQELLQ